MLYAGTAACALALSLLSANGFAPGGRFPAVTVMMFVVGALLVSARPRVMSADQYTSRT